MVSSVVLKAEHYFRQLCFDLGKYLYCICITINCMAKRFFATKKDPFKKSTIVVKSHGLLGIGSEKEVHDATVSVERGKRSKQREFVIKKFHEVETHNHSYSNPVIQVQNYNALKELNREKKLGLTIISTFRLIDAPGRTPGIVATRFRVLDWKYFPAVPAEVRENVMNEIQRQMKIVRDNGFTINFDAFVLASDGRNITPTIADFKFIHPRLAKETHEKYSAAAEEQARKSRERTK